MIELNTLIINKQTFNTAVISFDSKRKAKKWMDVLIEKKIPHTKYISLGEVNLYTFKMFRIKNRVFELAVQCKEVTK